MAMHTKNEAFPIAHGTVILDDSLNANVEIGDRNAAVFRWHQLTVGPVVADLLLLEDRVDRSDHDQMRAREELIGVESTCGHRASTEYGRRIRRRNLHCRRRRGRRLRLDLRLRRSRLKSGV